MNCRRMESLLSDYLEGALKARDQGAVLAHMRDCSACRRRRDAVIALEAKISEAIHWQPGPFPRFRRRALERWLAVREAPATARHHSSSPPPPFPALRLSLLGSAVLAIVAVLLSLSGWRHQRPSRLSPPQVVRREQPVHSLLPPSGVQQPTATSPTRPIVPPGPVRESAPVRIAPPPLFLGAPKVRRRAPAFLPPQPAVDDLIAINADPEAHLHQWMSVPKGQWETIEARVHRYVRVRDDFVTIPFPRLASTSYRQIAEAVASYKREAAIIDPRLAHEVNLQFKGTALSDVCSQLRTDTGIELTAGPSVTDEKVTIFCEKMPLREVMRQLARPFGYTWLRSKREGGDYRYELAQDLRSQLLEEELRNRDRNEALLALDREMNRYRKYLDLSPDEALARDRTAPPEEKNLLAHLATDGWGVVQMYFRLSPNEMAALRAGQTLIFSQEPKAGEQPLPADLARGILQSERDNRIFERDGAFRLGDAKDNPDGLLPTAVPEARAKLMLRMPQSELGQYTLTGGPGVFISASSQTPGGFSIIGSAGSLASGMSPAVLDPNNGAANANLARDPALHPHVTIAPVASCQASVADEPFAHAPAVSESPTRSKFQTPGTHAVGDGHPKSKIERVSSADVLEALHRATGRPIVSDFYTRLYPLQAVSPRNMPLFEALNQLSDAMRLRWGQDGAWLQFRSTSFFNDRLKEVPNRLLARWSASRHQHGSVTLDDLIEMAQLSDAQLDAVGMAEGAKACWGLAEWDLVHRSTFRPQLRYIAGFTPEQRRMATSSNGLPFTRLSLAQQQQFLSFFLKPGAGQLPSGEELTGATLRVDYSLPGAFQWALPESGWRQFLPPPVREPTREAALRAALRIDPQATDTQIAPTTLALSFLYTPGGPNVNAVRIVRTDRDGWWQP